MSAQKDYVNDVRSTSYNAATANPYGYMGTIDDAIARCATGRRTSSNDDRP